MYGGSPTKVPREYWDYILVEEHFRGNWDLYWRMPEPLLEKISMFRNAEAEAARTREKRLKQNGRKN